MCVCQHRRSRGARLAGEADGQQGYILMHTSFRSALYIGTSACSRSRARNDDVPASSLAPAYHGLASEARSTSPVHGVFGLPDVA